MKDGVSMFDILEKKQISNDVVKHIDNSLPKNAYNTLNGYVIALEGWRRGLNLQMRVGYDLRGTSRKVTFTLDDGKGISYSFNSASTSKTTREAKLTCINKERTKLALESSNVPQAKGKGFDQNTLREEFITFANSLGYPVVVKPSDGYGGKGITTDIRDDEQLISALDELKSSLTSKTKIIIEKYHTGKDYRLYVVGDEVVASAMRIPANIVGDGKSTIKELIEQKNSLRRKSKGPSNRSIINEDEELKNTLKEKNLTLDFIPSKKELIFIKKKANVSSGGESIDVTDEMRSEYKQIAIDAVKSIGGLYIGAVDLLIDDDKRSAIVLEINSKPGIDIQIYPTYGRARDIPEKLIDYLFPESIENKTKNSRKMYFDYGNVYKMTYIDSIFESVIIPPIPEFLVLRKYKINVSKHHIKNFMKYTRHIAHRYRISGFISEKDDQIILVAAGSQKSTRETLQLLEDRLKQYDQPYHIKEMVRTLPVKQGFSII